MVKTRRQLPYDVVEGARRRVISAFSNGVPVYLSISGGKDSIVLADVVHTLIQQGRIDPALLTVDFIDEEAMFDDVIDIAKQWRKRFMLAGARFRWWCIEVRHFNCFNQLTNDESFVCWDSEKRDVWVRPMPPFAITGHPMLKRRVDTYQEFTKRICQDGIRVVGTRTAESVQRLQYFKSTFDSPQTRLFAPIYDWRDQDVWRYIRDHNLDFPDTYLQLYQVGVATNRLRISQFFSVDTAKVLVKLGEFQPDLMAKVEGREPNAYLASLYWDTELFRSAGGKQESAGAEGAAVDWRAKTLERINSPEQQATSAGRDIARHLRSFLIRNSGLAIPERAWKMAYSMLVAGDPKKRTLRAFSTIALQSRKDPK